MFGRRANPCPREGGERRSYRPEPRRRYRSGRKESGLGLRGVFALLKGAIHDDAQLFGVIAEIANVAPMDLVWVGVEMLVAQGLQPDEHFVDLSITTTNQDGAPVVTGTASAHINA